jgi:catechol 2,3-dioxygenase-like lactoylglutathione lyase family enzyme
VRLRRLCWLGLQTARYEETVALFRDVLGLRVEFATPTTTELSLENGDRVQVFGPGDPYHGFLAEHATGPVALFEVDGVHEARAQLEAAGVEIVGPLAHDDAWEWIHFRGPDGNLYELAESRIRRSASP